MRIEYYCIKVNSQHLYIYSTNIQQTRGKHYERKELTTL